MTQIYGFFKPTKFGGAPELEALVTPVQKSRSCGIDFFWKELMFQPIFFSPKIATSFRCR